MTMAVTMAQKHLNDKDKERLLEQMAEVEYVSSYESAQRMGNMYQFKNRQPRKMLKIRECYCEKNLHDGFCELVFRHVSRKYLGNMNAFPCFVHQCWHIGNFFAQKQLEICRKIDETIQKNQLPYDLKALIDNEFIDEIYLKLTSECKTFCVRCNAECKLGMIGTSGINNFVNIFEDNFVVNDKVNQSVIASDNRSLRRIFGKYLNDIKLNTKDDVDDSDLVIDMLKTMEGVKNEFFNKLPECNYSNIISFAKKNIIDNLEKSYCEKYGVESLQSINYEVIADENRKMSKKQFVLCLGGDVSTGCAVLLNTLFLITDGYKEKFDNLAKMIAGIVIGPRLSQLFDIKLPQASLIKTNNTMFIKKFLLNIFTDLRVDSKVLGVTQYSTAELADTKMTGKFIEDKLYSRYVNITSKLNFNNSNECNKYLFNLIEGKLVKGKNEFLGEQSIRSSMYYVFLASTEDSVLEFASRNCNIIELGNSMPKDIDFIIKYKENKNPNTLNNYEIKFMLVHVANYGLELLLEEQRENINRNACDKVIKEPVGFFIEKCCTVVDNIGEGTKPNASNATAMPTFTAAYNLFYEIADGVYGNRKFDKNIEEEEGFIGKIVKDRSNDVRERDLQNGYSEDEVLKKDSKSNHCLGIIVKPKEEIKNIALEYKESLQHNMQKWSDKEFVDFMINLNQKYIYKY